MFFQNAKTIEVASFTDIGNRTVNEDSIGVFRKSDRSCFVVCDGLGGHGQGDIASRLVTDSFEKDFAKSDSNRTFMKAAFQNAQDALMEEQRKMNALKKMKTTAVCLCTDKHNAYIGHIGDSRAYVFRDNAVSVQTKDHSVVQMLASIGEIKEEEIRYQKDRNTLLRVMGVEWVDPEYELMKPIPLRKCQAFLLCSDGFWELIDEAEMCRHLEAADSADSWLNSMVRYIKDNSSDKDTDNQSAIAVMLK